MKLYDLLLSTRITIGVLAMVVAGTVTLLLVENARLRDVYLSERRTHLGQDLESGKLRLNQAINTLRQDVLFLSNTPPVSGIVRASLNRGYDPRYGNTSKVWEERLQQILSAFSSAHQDYYRIRYIGVADGGREIVRIDNRGGKIEATSPGRLQAQGDRDYFKAALDLREGQVSLSEFDLNRDWGVIERPYRPTLHATAPVFAPSGKLFGMVVINMDVGSLLKSAVSDLPGVQTYIANRDGQYLLHPDSHRAFKFEPGSKDEITADFSFIKTMFNPQAPDYLPLQTVATKPGSPLFAARRIRFDPNDPSRFLILMHDLPVAVAEQQIATIPVQAIIYELLVMLLVGGIAALVLRRTFSPLKQVTVAANKIAAGDQDIRLPLMVGGEIGSLTNALNAMLARLSQREKLLQESESRFRNLVETTSDWIWEIDENAVYTYASPQIRRILGYEAAEIIGKTPFDLMPPEEAKRVADIFGPLAAAKKPFTNIENTNLHKDGHPVILETSGVSVIDTEGKFCGYRGIDRDITERKIAEKALAKSEERARLAINASHLALWDYDLGTGSVYLSEGWSQLLGGEQQPTFTTIQELAGLVPEEDQHMVGTAIMEAVKGHVSSSYQITHRVRKLDGGYIWVLSEGHVVDRDRDGRALRMIGTNRDITERKQLEIELHRSEENLNRAQTIGQIGSWILDIPTRRLEWSAETYRMFGIAPQEAIDQEIFVAATHPGDRDFVMNAWGEAMAGAPFDIEHRIVVGDQTRWVRERAEIERDSEGRPLTGIGTVQDITERKRAEEAITKEGKKFHLLFDSISDAIFIHGMDGRFIHVNRSACERLGYSREELLQMSPADIDTPECAAKVPENAKALQERGELVCESAHVRRDGTVIPIELNARIIDYDGKPAVIAVARDITERKAAERKLRDLTEHLQSVREEEKASIAREIHDDLGGMLAALKIETYCLKTELPENREMRPFLDRIEEMSQLINNAAGVMRNIVTGLRPTILDDLGLLAALEWQAAQFHKRTGIKCRVNCIGDKGDLDKLRSIALFRISQEALTNVVRHSGASSVEIEFLHNDGEIVMSIIDNGCGIPENRTDVSIPYGLLGMCERVDQLGGMINFDTPPGGGFSVTVILSLPDSEEGKT